MFVDSVLQISTSPQEAAGSRARAWASAEELLGGLDQPFAVARDIHKRKHQISKHTSHSLTYLAASHPAFPFIRAPAAGDLLGAYSWQPPILPSQHIYYYREVRAPRLQGLFWGTNMAKQIWHACEIHATHVQHLSGITEPKAKVRLP